MKNLIYFLAITLSLVIVSCGSAKKDEEKSKTDSAAQSVVEVESWEAFNLATTDPAGFKSRFEGKSVLMKNVVITTYSSDGVTMTGNAYSPEAKRISLKSYDADKAKKQPKTQLVVQETVCVYEPDLDNSFSITLKFKEKFDNGKIKAVENALEENDDLIRTFHTILTVEAESMELSGKTIVMNNCVIKENNTK
ncbi:MAG: hypothetical protein CVU11_14280 [Bacteroidetes bacterium HGW-Bacteroidetes-6]|jgi:hypothetical protein|nr:MAG: hypothetical protein CVU11_14280 [Bacteroidetes bacterium HGW-Bacteroidetes-6]